MTPDEEAELYAEIGRRLRATREACGLSLGDVKEKSGGKWKAPTVRSWEVAVRQPPIHAILGLAGFYGVPPETLIPGFEGPDVPVGDLLGVLEHYDAAGVHVAALRAAIEPEGLRDGSTQDREVTP